LLNPLNLMWLEPMQGSEFVYYTDFTLKNGKFI
jgi:hypothetical protein